ncbi:putative malonyl-CoA decarboxylase, precursor [Trypanosoma vivax]|nr:putative malonyl-CoA decarboxylase, precursor [Trypanosoma vivax]
MRRCPSVFAVLRSWRCAFLVTSQPTGSLTLFRRHESKVDTLQYSEERIANWCRRLWALAQDGSTISTGLSSGAKENAHVAKPPYVEMASHGLGSSRLQEELKAVLVGERGHLPPSIVAAVWSVYESIVPPAALDDMEVRISAAQESAFFCFIALLCELDSNLADVRAAAVHLGHSIDTVEDLISQLRDTTKDGSYCDGSGAHGSHPNGGNTRASLLTDRLVVAKNELLRHCIAVRDVGSPVYYTWMLQTASLERGLRRLMDFRRCVTYFLEKSRSQISRLREAMESGCEENVAQNMRREVGDVRKTFEAWTLRQRHLTSIDVALQYIFGDLFSKQWLVMEELTWHSTPPNLLEKVISSERVHPFINGLADMKKRLRPAHDRHLFAFFHPAVVEEPLIAVQVALTRGIARSVDVILGRPSPITSMECQDRETSAGVLQDEGKEQSAEEVDTATFYSINSSQSALRGVNLGNLLIKRVVHEIEERLNVERHHAGLPPITTFSTLSPIPGYVPWLFNEVMKLQQYVLEQTGEDRVKAGKFSLHRIFGECIECEEKQLFLQLQEAVLDFAERHQDVAGDLAGQLHNQSIKCRHRDACLTTMKFILRLFHPTAANINCTEGSGHNIAHFAWWEDAAFTKAIEWPLLRSVAHYLYKEKRRGRILDSVGNFHISNGATMLRLNFLANCTPSGSRESATIMVNYLYEPMRVSERVKAYELHRTVSAGSEILNLLG